VFCLYDLGEIFLIMKEEKTMGTSNYINKRKIVGHKEQDHEAGLKCKDSQCHRVTTRVVFA
jgi:hypothetical protein